jgi:DMSO/TMAO reductase YedYZ molybdopterin-dependent catalytic subunit
MKKLLFAALAFACVGFGFTACDDDDDDNTYIYSNPVEQVAGTYTGTWTRVLDKDTTVADGSVVIAFHTGDSIETKYIADVTVDQSTTVGLDAMTSTANLVQAGQYGYSLLNVSQENGFGTSFRGRVQDEQFTLNFNRTVKVGRKSYVYSFTFVGTKLAE